MGISSSKKHDKEVTITIIGNSNVGKTALSRRFEGVKLESTVPTMGLQQVSFVRNKTLININDLGGNPSIMKIWENYYAESHGIIYVAASIDRAELESSLLGLLSIVSHNHVVNKPILIVLNKCDLLDSLRSEDVEKLFETNHYKNIILTEGSCSVENNNHLYKVLMKNFDIFLKEISKNYTKLSNRIAADKQSIESTKVTDDKTEPDLTPSTFFRRSTLMDAVKNMDASMKNTENKVASAMEGTSVERTESLPPENPEIEEFTPHAEDGKSSTTSELVPKVHKNVVTFENKEKNEESNDQYIDQVFPNEDNSPKNNLIESEDSEF